MFMLEDILMLMVIENIVEENDDVDYYFILQQIDSKLIDEKVMPRLHG